MKNDIIRKMMNKEIENEIDRCNIDDQFILDSHNLNLNNQWMKTSFDHGGKFWTLWNKTRRVLTIMKPALIHNVSSQLSKN